MSKKAIIIGGGPAGTVAALFLKRIGITAEVFEARAETDNDSGSFLNLAGNGIGVLQVLGIDKAVVEQGSPVPRMVMWNGRGKPLGEVRNGARAGLTKSVTLRRGALQMALHAVATEHGITIHYGRKLSHIETSNDGCLEARFENGSSAWGDLLLGCDGVHSRTRQIINPQAPKPQYTGLISTGGFTRLPSLLPTPDTQHFFFGRRAFFGYHVRTTGEVYWFNNHEQTREPRRGEIDEITNEEWQERLIRMHQEDLPFIQNVIRATEQGIAGYPIYDIATQPVWHKGTVVLLGDAVHAVSPSSGQGASLAMEDAGVLARCLRDIPSMQDAFVTYESLRRERVERIVEWARKLGSNKAPATALQAWFRDLLMPFFLRFAANPAKLDWIYDYHLDWNRPLR